MPDAIIDGHQHFWKYSAAEYGWIDDGMSAIRRDFLPRDLLPELRSAGVNATLAVQARQTLEETAWLLELAAQNESIAGVVGWVPLIQPDAEEHIHRFAADPKLKGVRHVLQDESDDGYMLRAGFNDGLSRLRQYDLVYDILIYERHLPQTIQFVDRHPDQRFVLDHIAKPRIRDRAVSPWKERIAELARRENVWCKLSGMVTEADRRNWTAADLTPYFDTVLEVFGPKRLLFGSDWPVMLLACDYARWRSTVAVALRGLSTDERAGIFGGTAAAVYRLGA